MQKVIIKIIAFAIKLLIIYFLLILGLKWYKPELSFYIQHPLVWLLIYLPLVMGYESLINVIFSPINFNDVDFSRTENNKVTIKHFEWLGFKNVNGSLQKEGFNGEIQFYDENFWFCQDNVAVKKIVIEKDINDIYLKQKYN